ncbi:MAG: tRNA pseudouridine(38-40) synthase TruA [Proteobacteria bacterium]|nr:tRNA pseudouridine(38-40) synthase TruA [Pseudomonadota bacterium]
MLTNFKLTIEYDGSAFHGWQIQPGLPTIQNEIQRILKTMTQEEIKIYGSGRTDAGVHALAQVAHFSCDTRISAERFRIALNLMLPPGIVIKDCQKVDASFHARYSVKKKTYRYSIFNSATPRSIGRNYFWFIPKPLDIQAMQAAANHLVGEMDYKSFEGTGSPRTSTVRHIDRADFQTKDNWVIFEISANGFLKFMVRNIVGTLVDVGLGKLTPDEFRAIIQSKDRTKAGATAPPQGLFLVKVDYDPS